MPNPNDRPEPGPVASRVEGPGPSRVEGPVPSKFEGAPNMRTVSLNSREFYEAVREPIERPWIMA